MGSPQQVACCVLEVLEPLHLATQIALAKGKGLDLEEKIK